MLFQLSDQEFLFLRAFCAIPKLTGFEDLQDLQQLDNPERILAGLEEKDYLHQDGEDGYALNEELTFLLLAAKQADSAFTIAGRGKQFTAWFKADAIVLCLTEQTHQLMWVPFLPMLIGAAADFMNPFLNRKTAGGLSDTPEELLQSGSEKEWEFSFFENGEPRPDIQLEGYTDHSRQVLIQWTNGQALISAPDKTDYVNSITAIIVPLHGAAIQKGDPS